MKKFKFLLNGKEFTHNKEWITGNELLALLNLTKRGNEVVQLFRFGRTEFVELDEKVDLVTSGIEKFVIAYKFMVYDKVFHHEKEFITGREILQKVGIPAKGSLPVQVFRFGRTEFVELNEKVDLVVSGVEKFTLSFKFKVDKKIYTWNELTISGQKIFTLIDKSPNENTLVEKSKNGQNPVGLNEYIDLTKVGIEKFVTIPSDATEGYMKRQDFVLPEDDRNFLEKLSNEWETIRDGNKQWLIIKDFILPKGYNHERTDMALLIPRSYPTAQIDMAYFENPLARKDGKSIRALSNQQIKGKNWQRWSRHRTGKNPWRPDVDDISTHIALVNNFLTNELQK